MSKEAMEDCIQAIENGNCPNDCLSCPIHQRFEDEDD